MRLNIIVSAIILVIPLTLYGEFFFSPEQKLSAYDLAELSCQLSCEKERQKTYLQEINNFTENQTFSTSMTPVANYAMCIRSCIEGIVGKEYAESYQKSQNSDMLIMMLLMGSGNNSNEEGFKDASEYFYSNLPPALDVSIPKDDDNKDKNKRKKGSDD